MEAMAPVIGRSKSSLHDVCVSKKRHRASASALSSREKCAVALSSVKLLRTAKRRTLATRNTMVRLLPLSSGFAHRSCVVSCRILLKMP